MSLAVLFGIAATWLPAPAVAAASAKLAPDRRGAIHTCYGHSDWNELHVVAERAACPRGYDPLSWDQRRRGSLIDADQAAIENWSFTFSTSSDSATHNNSVWKSITDAGSGAAALFVLLGLGMLALSLLLVPLLRGPLWVVGHWPWAWRRIARWFGPALQIQSFEDSALRLNLGTAFARLTQIRVGGGREGGRHLYLVTGEESPGSALAELKAVPQAWALAAALSLLKLTLWRRRLVVNGALTPADDRGGVAVALTLRSNSKFIGSAEFWPIEGQYANMTSATSNRVLAVAAAGWIEHRVVDETPGPPAREVFLSHDPRSWALFRAGSELSRISYLKEGADYYERALAIDDKNIGALIDLAHLRRLEEHFDGAESLAYSGIDLITQRHQKYKRRKGLDPIWYRAQIVLATVHAEWAKNRDAMGDAATAKDRRTMAYERALKVARTATKTRRWLETHVGEEELNRAAEGPKISRGARKSGSRQADTKGWQFDPDRAVELYVLLRTTFEPGSLLLVAATGPNRDEPPSHETDREIRYSKTDGKREPLKKRIARTRQSAGDELQPGTEPHPGPLIVYIRTLPRKSPRVVYNLACYYAIAAANNPAHRKEYLKIASEYLRQSISRSPPRERRGLLEHARTDEDLVALREDLPDDIVVLEGLIPYEPAGPRPRN